VRVEPLLARIAQYEGLPALAKELFDTLGQEYARLQAQLRKIEAKLMAWHRHNEMSRRLAQVPSIGPVIATAMAIKVPDPKAFRSGRDLAQLSQLARQNDYFREF